MGTLFPKVLYFIAGTAPTADQVQDADAYGPGVAFRNASLIHPDGPIEEADAVAGDHIPENYAEAIPHASDTQAVKERLAKRNPNLAEMLTGEKAAPTEETEDQRASRIDNALARGQRQPPVNERNSDPVMPSARTTQSGDARVTRADDGWSTNPETVNDASAAGRGLGETEGNEGQPGAAPVGAQGEGGPGQRTKPKPPRSGQGNPRKR